jgi:Rrf2 family iron-sulfur cluster assembly transcriptional regulator
MYSTMNSDYALRAMIHLAGGDLNGSVPISQVARAAGIPEPYLRKIIPHLQHAGLIQTTRGNRGGITLARPANTISVLDIILPVEEKLAMHFCLLEGSICDRKIQCPMHDVWVETETAVRRILAFSRLDQLVNYDSGNKTTGAV